jgi:hypothetical protein
VPYNDVFGASPDGYVSDSNLIEIKCPYGLRNGGEFKSIDEQKHYYAQIQMQLICTDYEQCWFYQWTPQKTMLELVNKDEEFITEMIKQCREFYQEYLIERELPDAQKYLIDKTKKVFDSEQLNETMRAYQFLKIEKDRIDEKMKEYLAEMIALTDEKGGVIYGHNLYKTERSGAISYSKAIKDLLPNADLEPYRGKSSEFWTIK